MTPIQAAYLDFSNPADYASKMLQNKIPENVLCDVISGMKKLLEGPKLPYSKPYSFKEQLMPTAINDLNDVKNLIEDLGNKIPDIRYWPLTPTYSAPKTLDSIFMPHISFFKSWEYFYLCLFHELAHATGHSSRQKRQRITNLENGIEENDKFSAENIGEEFVAQIAAILIMRDLLGKHAIFEKNTPFWQLAVAYLQDFIYSNPNAVDKKECPRECLDYFDKALPLAKDAVNYLLQCRA